MRARLPSRNWLIFLSLSGSFAGAILYDRSQQRRVQQRWVSAVSHLAAEPLAPSTLPRKITVFLAAPPGDGTRPAREHFHAYVKPLLVAAALDWDVVEGRREGDVRARWAERIRNRRRLSGEKGEVPPEEDPVEEVRRQQGTREADATGGHLVIGRHTWKEYVRGLHEGWLGPLDPPPPPPDAMPAIDAAPASEATAAASSTDTTASPSTDATATSPPSDAKPSETTESKPPESPTKAPVPTPYVAPAAYPQAPLPSTLPTTFPAATAIPLPHLLGFRHTPWRIWRFLHRREVADDAGRRVAALVLAASPRAFEHRPDTVAAAEGDAEVEGGKVEWEQQSVLAAQEADWHKSAWADRKPKSEEKKDATATEERPWREPVVVDERIGARMRTYEALPGKLRAEDEDGGEKEERRGKSRQWLGGADERWERSWGEWARGLVGGEKGEGRRGWEDGLVGEE